MIIFWIIQKPYHVHIWWCESGRKLPTAYTSQQLQVVEAKEIYFFNFFVHKKLKKIEIYTTQQTTYWHIDSSLEIMSAKVRKVAILDTKIWDFGRPEIAHFGHFGDHVRSSKSQKSAKSRKIRKIAKIPKKCTFWLSEGYPTCPARIAVRSTFRQVSAGLARSCQMAVGPLR